MKEKKVMSVQNTVHGAMAECHVIFDGKPYDFMQAISLHTEFRIIRNWFGRPKRWAGIGTVRFHYNDSAFRRIMAEARARRKDIYFDMLVTNEDPYSNMGRQTILLKGCRINSGAAALFDAESPFLEDFAKFTFKDFEFKEKFQCAD